MTLLADPPAVASLPPEVYVESRPCPAGCVRADEPVLTGHDTIYDRPGDFSVVRCQTCGLMRTDPRPTPQTMGFYYPDDYGPYVGTQVAEGTAPISTRPKSGWRRWGGRLISYNTQCLPPLRPGRLLEVGCASGSFLRQMAGAGWDVEGIEFSPRVAQAARALGYPVFAGSIESAPDPSEPFDLAVGWMVLEHLHDPVLALQKLHRWTRPGGWLAFSVPNAGAKEFRLFGRDWYALQVPTHLYHYTPHTLDTLLEMTGWKMERVFYQRTMSNVIASIGLRLKRTKAFAGAGRSLLSLVDRPTRLHLLLYPIAYALSLFGQTGRMTVWARRTDD